MKIPHALSLAATFLAISLSLQQPPPPEPAPAEQTRPNVVIIMTDDQDPESLPAMRKLMSYPEGSWINFTNAYTNDSLCTPSRATILTGQYSQTHRVTTNGLSYLLNDKTTLPVWLDDAGYNTALIGKYLIGPLRNRPRGYVPPGWDVYKYQEFDVQVDSYTTRGLDFIRQATSPWFLWLAYRAPHTPATPPARYATADVFLPAPRPNVNERDVSDKPFWVRSLPLMTPTTIAKWEKERLASQRELMAIDDGVQSVIDLLKSTGQLDNTMIIFMGDNGMSWGSHRRIGKWCPYEECSRVPLLIRYPGARGNRIETRYVSNVDIASTIAEYTGVTPTAPQDGRSLIPLLTDTAVAWENSVLLERHVAAHLYAIAVPGWKYVEYNGGFKELYDLTADPFEMQNVAKRIEYQAKRAELAGQLHQLMP